MRLPNRVGGLGLLVGLALLVTPARAQPPEPDKPAEAPGAHPYAPSVAPASAEASVAMKAFRVPADFKLGLWAAEPMLANPVVFGFDEKGAVYVVETFRLHHGVTDTRGHMNWLDDDLASRSVADRVAKYKKFLGKDFASYGVEHDRIRLLRDTDDDKKADRSDVFADGFNNVPDGLAAGVLARNGDVYFTCIPDLWLLRDTNHDGKADVKKSLGTGYGVHTGFLGHDLHGLRFGPDGKLYFTIGDRGLNVRTADRRVFLPDTGAVLRCNADGTELELFATGLRNPQEIAFDEHGNLFTVDNNSDSGDKARVVYVVEGSDSGWTMGWQYIEWPNSRGPWNAEKLWYPQWDGQPAHIVPPLANLSDGPSGLTYDPGATLLPDRLRRHFFLADFRGASGTSGVRSFAVKPKGAGFEVVDAEQFVWGVLATDVDFAPDGSLYVSDWVEGWDGTGKGRLYRLADDASPRAPQAAEVKALLAEGFDGKGVEELAGLLAHADQRARQGAQFALAGRGKGALGALRKAAESGPNTLARIHAVWGLGQLGRKAPEALAPLPALLGDKEPEVRAQAAKTLGDVRARGAAAGVVALLKDESPRVRSLAAIAVGKLGGPGAVPGLLGLLRENADKDPFLRHSAVVGLAGCARPADLVAAATDPSSAVRLGVVLALRRLQSVEVARLLDDPDPRIVAEVARAIYDAGIDAALPLLGRLADRPGLSESALRRVVNAAFRVGGADRAKSLAALATRSDLPETVRVEAVKSLGDWVAPSGRDRVTGLWRPVAPHPAREAAEALAPIFPGLVNGPSEELRMAAIEAATRPLLGGAPPAALKEFGRVLGAAVADTTRSAASRAEALRALARLEDPGLSEAVALAVKDRAPRLANEGRALLAKLDPAKAIPVLAGVLETGALAEKQGAFATLGSMPAGPADALLSEWLDRWKAGKLAPELVLDLREAAARRGDANVKARLAAAGGPANSADPLARYQDALVGGDAARGQKIVAEKAEVSCLRCHKVNNKGGEVGPVLNGVASKRDRKYLLESIVAPNAQIAEGFETLIVATSDGQVHSGILKGQDDKALTLITPEAKLITLPKADIEEQKRGASAMPADLITHLSAREVRDLVEYLDLEMTCERGGAGRGGA